MKETPVQLHKQQVFRKTPIGTAAFFAIPRIYYRRLSPEIHFSSALQNNSNKIFQISKLAIME